MIVGNVMALGEETQKKYGFATKSWGVFEGAGDWTSGKDGNQYTSGRGVQVTTAASGANATSPISFNNISRIDVIYSTNASKGKGTISLQVGSNTSKSFTVTSSGGITDRTASFEYSPNESGSVKITVTCSENSIYIKSVTITYSDSSPSGTVSTPTFSPGAGEVTPGTEVFFNCNTEGVTYYYTTDGTEPTTSSTSGTSYIVNSGVTLKVIAVKEGMNNSQVATATYTIAKNDPELAFSETSVTANYGESFTPPTLTHAEGYDGTITYSSSNSAITVDSSTGAITFDASAVGKTTTITATASETDNYRSGTATYVLSVVNPNAITGNLNNATFGTNYGGTITPIASFTSVSGTIGSGDKVVTVTYSKGTSSNAYINNSEIRLYNGSLLTFEAPEGYAILSLVFNTTLTACQPIDDIGSISGNTWSAPNDENVTNVSITKTTSGGLALNKVDITLIALGTAVPKPTISPASGTYTEAQTVTITNNAEGATVYYTTDGTTPTTSSTVYSAPFTLSSNGTYEVKAIAVVDGNSSSVATSTITIQIYVEAPTINPADGTQITEETSISISTAAADLTIYYTTDSTDPVKNGELTSSAKAYNGAFTLSKAGTVKAVAMNSDGVFSEIVSATYTYNGTVTAPYYEN